MSSEDPLHKKVKELNHLPSLDGWRAISIFLVLLSHCKSSVGFPKNIEPILRWIPDGGFGVRSFFVISGFLITWLLIKEHEKTGRISLTEFYWRRSVRILPAYIVFLAALVALSRFTAFTLPTMSWLALCTYTVNYVHTPWTGAHVWSLSIEEQFYIIWPFIFILLIHRTTRVRWLLGALAVPILLFPVCRAMGYMTLNQHLLLGKYSFLLQGDAIAVGCAGAVILWHSPSACGPLGESGVGILTVASFLILLPHVLTRLFLLGPLTVPLGLTVSSVGICLLVLHSISSPEWGIYRTLQRKPLVWVGTLSYSIYLWQQIFCSDPTTFGFLRTNLFFQFPTWLIPTFVAALASHYLIERPCLRLKGWMSSREISQ